MNSQTSWTHCFKGSTEYFISSSLKVLQSVASGQTNSSVSITKSAHSRHLNLTFYVETAYRRYQIGKCVILAINMPLCIGRPTIIWHHLTPKFVIGTQCICLREWQCIVLGLAKVVSESCLFFLTWNSMKKLSLSTFVLWFLHLEKSAL